MEFSLIDSVGTKHVQDAPLISNDPDRFQTNYFDDWERSYATTGLYFEVSGGMFIMAYIFMTDYTPTEARSTAVFECGQLCLTSSTTADLANKTTLCSTQQKIRVCFPSLLNFLFGSAACRLN